MASANNNNEKMMMNEESSPLLANQANEKKPSINNDLKNDAGSVPGWTADGLPMGGCHGSVVGEPVMGGRRQWNSGLFSCLGHNDEFCSSDLEVCLLGSVAPCVLYGSNVERLAHAPGTFANHCLPYTGLFLIGNSFFGSNCLAPCFSYPSRIAIRRKFNLEGSCETLHRSCGCCGSCVEDDVGREHCESACDFVTHVFCHLCALCQEGRELRRQLPHPGFNAQRVLVMAPPEEQAMGRYESFKPMHEMWKIYIKQLLKNVGNNQLANCLLGADLHGAIILVVQCKNTDLNGVHGFMIRETAETFGVITEDDKLRVVPKKLSVFVFQVDCWKITLLGDKLTSRNIGF